jgi:inner membrane protease subunit 1
MPFLRYVARPFQWMKDRYAGHPFRLLSATLKTSFVAHVFWEYGFSFPKTQGPSMLPTFEVVDDWVVVSRKFRRGRGIEVGDIISFDSVVEPGAQVIKRVLGLEGDYVLRDTPGMKNQNMIQVGWIFLLVERMVLTQDRFRQVIVGWLEIIYLIREIQDILDRCQWL